MEVALRVGVSFLEPTCYGGLAMFSTLCKLCDLFRAPPCDLTRNYPVFDQEETKPAPFAVQVRKPILAPLSIQVDQPLRERHGALVEEPCDCHPRILQVPDVFRLWRGPVFRMESLHPQAVPPDQPCS